MRITEYRFARIDFGNPLEIRERRITKAVRKPAINLQKSS